MAPLVIEHRLHRLLCSCCSTSTCMPLPTDVEAIRDRPRLISLVGLMDRACALSFRKSLACIRQLEGAEISYSTIATMLRHLSAALAQAIAAGSLRR
ncbi:hypothetical protein KBZ12_14040 [Cyanobium sp. Cruz CV13-4-11]|uniref:hypothetical protein n=1 Tax=unclassified Cyanobium TaxID=2627006 RepID=UPI0020CFB432|nr:MULTISPECIES: hypothetical protein [unclassified Cyanobium]MCP9901477.1 hypothetical protein [Cyanobium sp. Cruz CV11-17]MCP9920577.1 hypothetical protein [Cyanobium sp. Cruz CV13-4-11]